MKLLDRAQIDDDRWNKAVLSNPGFRHYYLTYYLDAAASDWCALVVDDYSFVWPIPYKIFPVKRVFQPLLIQQLGPIMHAWDQSLFNEARQILESRFSAGRVKHHSQIPVSWLNDTLQHRNIELDLSTDVSVLVKAFNRNAKSNIKRFQKSEGIISRITSGQEEIITLFKEVKGRHVKALNDDYYDRMSALFQAFLKRKEAEIWIGRGPEGNLWGGVLLLTTNGRLLNLLSVASSEGRKSGVMHAIFGEIIEHYAGNASVLDFEGSNDENLAFFYQSFGGVEQLYLQSEWSRIPWPLNRFL